jgi:hypothetical protein
MTQVLTLAGGGDSGDPAIETVAAVGRIMRTAVSSASVAGDLTPQRAASQALRALNEPTVLLAALARDEPARPIWRRIVQASAKLVILVPVAARGQPGRPLGRPPPGHGHRSRADGFRLTGVRPVLAGATGSPHNPQGQGDRCESA